MKHVKSILISAMFLALATPSVYGQQDKKPADVGKQEPAKEEKSAESTENANRGTYLDVVHAKENSIVLDENIREDIYLLQVVVGNFGEASDKSTLESIQKDHVQGKKELFKRKYLNSYNIFKKVSKNIQELYTKLVTQYQTKANEILGLCAETLVDRETGSSNKSNKNPEVAAKTSKQLMENKIRLVIAYDQLNMGDKFKFDERLSNAVTHYRLAKLHGINILVNLAETEADKTTVKNQYKTDLMDGENLVSK